MGYNIAVAGKGGTGKTSLTGLLVNNLTTNNKGPVLVVDADANANINEVLGIEVETTIGSIREEVNQREKQGNAFPGGMTKADKLSDAYEYLVIDNEAGMEHLSRKTTKHIDKLLLVSDCSRRSVQAVARIRDLARELNLSVGDIYLIVNKAPNGELNEGIKEEIDKHNLNLIGVVPMDEMIYEYDSSGIPLVNLPEDSKAKIAINDIMAKLELN